MNVYNVFVRCCGTFVVDQWVEQLSKNPSVGGLILSSSWSHVKVFLDQAVKAIAGAFMCAAS